jgi:hypothetical protein
MEDFGQRIAEASTKEEMLDYRHKLLDMKQEMLNSMDRGCSLIFTIE